MKPHFPVLSVAGGLLLDLVVPDSGPRFVAAFSTRVALEPSGPAFINYGFSGDIPGAASARSRLCHALGLEVENFTCGEQVHGVRAVFVDEKTAGAGGRDPDSRVPETDALFTDAPGVPLAVCTADCVPVLISDGKTGAVAAVHAGWRGAVGGIVEKTIEEMGARCGADAGEMTVYTGPSIGSCCFEIQQDVAGLLEGADAGCIERRGGSMFLDLRRLVALRVEAAGVPPERIHVRPACTSCNTHMYYSYRGDRRVRGSNISLIARLD